MGTFGKNQEGIGDFWLLAVEGGTKPDMQRFGWQLQLSITEKGERKKKPFLKCKIADASTALCPSCNNCPHPAASRSLRSSQEIPHTPPTPCSTCCPLEDATGRSNLVPTDWQAAASPWPYKLLISTDWHTHRLCLKWGSASFGGWVLLCWPGP